MTPAKEKRVIPRPSKSLIVAPPAYNNPLENTYAISNIRGQYLQYLLLIFIFDYLRLGIHKLL